MSRQFDDEDRDEAFMRLRRERFHWLLDGVRKQEAEPCKWVRDCFGDELTNDEKVDRLMYLAVTDPAEAGLMLERMLSELMLRDAEEHAEAALAKCGRK
jgi:hypothetical protein